MAAHHDRASGLLDPASVDVLSDALRTLRLTGALFFPVEASSPWVNEIPASHQLGPLVLPGAQHVVSYHIVTRGECWISLPQAAPARLEAGDIVVIPHGDPYVMSSAPQAPPDAPRDSVLEFFRQMATGSVPAVIVDGGGGPERAKLVCGFLACDVRPFNPILETLPRLLLLRPPPPASDRLGRLVEFALEESLQNRPGARCVLLRLSEVLFVEVVRRHLEGLPSDQSGWLAGLRDPVVGHALALLHARPARSWTLERLAREIAVSRSILADRFTRLLGQPPMRYLARWRMQLAATAIAAGTTSLAAVARDVGYGSEAAFSRSFKRIVGASPASWRRRRAPGSREPLKAPAA